MAQRILVIDDDAGLRDTVALMLEQEGFEAISAADGEAGIEQALAEKPDLAIVDLRLPGLSGIEVCRRLRQQAPRTAIVVLSALGDEVDKVLLLETGADDYVVKPFGRRELLARIRAVLRRSAPEPAAVLAFGEVEIDVERRSVQRAGAEVKLTPAEYNLLVFFAQNPDRPLTRDLILHSVWGYEGMTNTRTVDAHVVKLRQKLEPDAEQPRHFVTVHGVGYRFQP
jgi:DNA-binding response OmpR family regulator